MKYARIENNIVKEVIDFDPRGKFTQEISQQFVRCTESTKQNMKYESGVFKGNVVEMDPVEIIINELAELDKIITRQSEQIYIDIRMAPGDELMKEAIDRKQHLRLLLNEERNKKNET